jgi:XTP/dITP diphosphohydrolase
MWHNPFMDIIFVTTNERKIGEAKLACSLMGINVIPKKIDLAEIQSSNPIDISKHKAEQAFMAINKPLVVTDTFWTIPSLNGFPGAYMHEVADWFSAEDFIALIRDKSDKRIYFSENITYIDKNETKIFSKEFEGIIVDIPRGTGLSIEKVAEFDGYTLGERREQGGFSHSSEDYVWHDFAKWFKAKH